VPANGAFDAARTTARLADGGVMTWDRESGPLKARQPYLLKFHVQDANGEPARDLMPYMGMPGHAIILRRDLTVFAHVHPFGTAPMASLALAARPSGDSTGDRSAGNAGSAASQAVDPHAGHMMSAPNGAAGPLPPVVTFPYGFPRAGDYRLFIQVKRPSGVQTGTFDVHID
jgi:hypothetical protein